MGGQQSQEPLTSYQLANGTTLVYDGDGNVVNVVTNAGVSSTPAGDSAPFARQFEQLWQRGLQIFSDSLGRDAQQQTQQAALQNQAALDSIQQRRLLNYALLAAGVYAAFALIKKLG